MQSFLPVGALAGIVALGFAACAQQLPGDVDPAGLQQAETQYPPDPPQLKEADRVDWRNAARPPTDIDPSDPRSNFVRAQSLMAKLSNAVYNPQAEFDRIMNPVGIVGNRITSGGGKWAADAYVGGSERLGMVFVALRGTSNFADFLTDFLMVPTVGGADGLSGNVHTGFALYANAVYSDVRASLDLACNPNLDPSQKVPLWVTGHSLGAAAAPLMAYRLKQAGCNVAGVALFGAPRPGLADFQAAYEASLPNITQRWRSEKDPIYCMPPGGAWRHVGTENIVHLNGAGISIGVSSDESFCTSEKIAGLFKNALAGIDPVGFVTSNVAQAIADWLKGIFNIGLSCPQDLQWDNTLSFAACKVTDFGYGIASVYGNLQPGELWNGIMTLAMLKFHQPEEYVAHLQADWNDPQAEWVNVRVFLPPAAAQAVLREEIYQGVCTPDLFDEANPSCDFEAPVGGVIRITSDDPLVPEPGNCDRYGGEHMLDCELDISGPRTIFIADGMVI